MLFKEPDLASSKKPLMLRTIAGYFHMSPSLNRSVLRRLAQCSLVWRDASLRKRISMRAKILLNIMLRLAIRIALYSCYPSYRCSRIKEFQPIKILLWRCAARLCLQIYWHIDEVRLVAHQWRSETTSSLTIWRWRNNTGHTRMWNRSLNVFDGVDDLVEQTSCP